MAVEEEFDPLKQKWIFDVPEEIAHENIYDFFPGIIYVYNTHTKKLSYVNKKISDVLGFSSDEIKTWDNDLTRIIHKDDLDRVQTELDKFNKLSDGDSHSYSCRLNHKKGDWIHFNVMGKVLRRDETGQASSLLLVAQDINEQIRLHESSADREKRIQELDRSNRELQDFAYAASHDLQEPLRKIATLTDLLQNRFSGVLEEEGKNYIERIQRAAKNARTLIDSLMEFSQITRSESRLGEINLESVLKEVLEDLELKIEEAHATIHTGNLPTLLVSPVQIKQLFSNILLNAIKFRKNGVAPEIDIQGQPLSKAEIGSLHLNPAHNYYSITIRDNGIGFEKAYEERIFQMFSRLHGKSEYPGMGIGLALCRKIVDFHEGIIFASGVPGEGAVFTIILPERHS